MDDNTLYYYDQNAGKFFQNTVYADLRGLYPHFLPRIPAGGRILDLGCGSGRDSAYFIKQGYEVQAVDGSRELCRLASQYIGREVSCVRNDALAFPSQFHGIWACASLLHVGKQELPAILLKLHKALLPGGILYSSFKYGQAEREQDGRRFSDYTENEMPLLFPESAGWRICELFLTQDVRPGRGQERWVNVIAEKKGRRGV